MSAKYILKILTLGDQNVGKSSIILKYTEDKSDKKRIKKEIKELENQKETKLPHHLISYWTTFIAGEEPIITECYIWDKINLYISPDDPENYMIEI